MAPPEHNLKAKVMRAPSLSPEALVRAGRSHAGKGLPWFARTLYTTPYVITENLPGLAALDQYGRVYFNLPYLKDLVKRVEARELPLEEALKEVGFLWYHELMHQLRRHRQRAEALQADPHLWSIAADLEINDDCPPDLKYPVQNQHRMVLLPEDFGLEKGKLAEEYYKMLSSLPQSPKRKKKSSKSKRKNASEPPTTSHPQTSCASNDNVPQPSQAPLPPPPPQLLNLKPRRSQVPLDEGSGVHGQSRPWELPPPQELPNEDQNPGKLDGQVPSKGLKPGVMPKEAPRQVKPVNRSAVPWGILLRRLAAQNLSSGGMHQLDYTFQRPHRRNAILHPLYLPALREMPNFASRIACVIDTSGSIKDYQLSQALHEVWRLAYEFRAQVTVIPCDREPKEPISLLSRRDWDALVKRGLPGGGGTDMRAGLKAALDLSPRPNLILIFTDGRTPYPEKVPKKVPVLWIIWTNMNDSYTRSRHLFFTQPWIRKHVPLPPMPPWHPNQVILASPSIDFSSLLLQILEEWEPLIK